MALLVTSCTMGKHPRQLLDKGPEYLRTKTNSKLFAHHRRSAVELLAASKPQFVKSTLTLNEDFERDKKLNPNLSKSPLRCKSEYDLTKIRDSQWTQDNIDELDGENVGSEKKLTVKAVPYIHRPVRRKINMSNQKNLTESATTSHNLENCRISEQSDDPNTGQILRKYSSSSLSSTVIMSDEEKMVVDNVMTLSTDMSSTQDVDMDYKSSFVQRSHSDLSCQHSRNSSIVSDRSSARYSRASADLEKFFNGMGIERNILDPMLRRQDTTSQRDLDIFEGVSSLDSPDTRSVCSGVSKLSEKTFSSSDCSERTLQSTSVVERNARIIKWLCNIKKAKQPLTND
ncbi:protein FAM110C [Patella vulgata]|uniref:protein FAM110C n=1 Tax=Patella vulgata TaxID=6465 RepID=UPI00217FD9A8|nr:protein FAM110C [Patella vulgata]